MMNLSLLFPVIGMLIFIALLLVFVWIWALIDCIKSESSAEYKLMWLLIIIFLNIFGAVLYFIFGNYRNEISFKRKGKYLTRSSDNKIVGGVCGGLAEHFEFDPAIIRILWVIFTIFVNGIGILLYIIAWIAIPIRKKDDEKKSKENKEYELNNTKKKKNEKHKSDLETNNNFKKKKKSLLGIVFTILVLTLVVSFVLLFVFVGNMNHEDVKQVSIKNLVVDVRSDTSEKTVIDEIIQSYNYKNNNGHELKLIEINKPNDDSCTIYERDPYGLKIYDSGCKEFVHTFSVDSQSLQGYRVDTLTSGGRILKMTFTEIEQNLDKTYCLPEQRNADFCAEYFEPVCGYNELAESETFSNDCFACTKPEIVYFVKGQCQ